jgi:hypothetical protein
MRRASNGVRWGMLSICDDRFLAAPDRLLPPLRNGVSSRDMAGGLGASCARERLSRNVQGCGE